MQGLILAAGRGSRLGDRSGGTAKALLEVGRKPLVEHAIEALSGCGVGPLAMVVGFAAHEIEERVGIKAEYILNTRWSATNSLYSFWLARDWVKDGVIVLNCDVLFSPQIVEKLIDTPGDAIAYDSASGERREEMSVKVVDGCLKDMSKTMAADDVCGENVGIIKLTGETARLLFARAEALIQQGREKDWLGAALREVAQERPIRAVDIHGIPWAEIDFPSDLDRARKITWPAIQRTQRRSRTPLRIARWATVAAMALLLTFASFRAWVKPVESMWETIPAVGTTAAVVTNGAQSRRCGVLLPGESATVAPDGPTTLRIDTRPLFDDAARTESHFVLQVSMDGKEIGWHSVAAKPSATWRLGEKRLGKRFRLEIEVPAGNHEVVATLAGSDAGGCIVRFSQLVGDL